jgi:hypothetical protein
MSRHTGIDKAKRGNTETFDRIERLREKFFAQMYSMTARSEFCLRVLDALEDDRLPRERAFTLHDVFAVVCLDDIVAIHKQTPDPLKAIMDGSMGEISITSPEGQVKRGVAWQGMLSMCERDDAIFEPLIVFRDDTGIYHHMQYAEYEAVMEGGLFLHPVRGNEIHDAAQHMEFAFRLRGPD